MKYFYTYLGSLFLFALLVTPVLAQATYQIYVHDVKAEFPTYTVGDTITGEFSISNLADISQSDIYYTISVGQYDEEGPIKIINVSNKTERQGPLYLKPNAKDVVDFQYTLPQSLNGKSGLIVTANLKDGTFVGQGELIFNIVGDLSAEKILLTSPYLEIIVPESEIDLESLTPELKELQAILEEDTIEEFENVPFTTSILSGPSVYEGERIYYKYSLATTSKVYTLKPKVRLYNRIEAEENFIKEIEFPSIKTSDVGSVDGELELPTDLDPLVYFGVLSFEEVNNEKIDFPVSVFRYIVAGPIATILNVNTDILDIQSGKNIPITITYGGQPIDEFRPEMQLGETTDLIIEVVAYNEAQEEIGRTTSNLDMNQRSIDLSIMAQKDAERISFNVEIKDNNGGVYSKYDTVLPTYDEVEDQEIYASKFVLDKTFVLIALGILVLISLCYTYARFKKSKNILPHLSLVFLLLVLGTSVKVDAWEIVSEFETDNFRISAITSPLPPEIKSYAQGEKFDLTLSVSYGDCNNESQTFFAASPSQNPEKIRWYDYKDVPQSELTRVGWWSENGKEIFYKRYKFDTSFIRHFIFNGDLEAIGMTTDEVTRLREIIGITGVVASYTVGFRTRDIELLPYGYLPGWEVDRTTTFRLHQGFGLDRYEELRQYLLSKGIKGDLYNEFVFNTESNKRFAEKMFNIGGYQDLREYFYICGRYGCTSMRGGQAAVDYYRLLDMKARIKQMYGRFRASKLYSSAWQKLGANFSFSAHGSQNIPYIFTQTYKAPNIAGYHDIYAYAYQDGNGGDRYALAKQTICVTGAGVCPNEKLDPVICPFLTGKFTQDDSGVIYRNGVPTLYVQDKDGNCNQPPSRPDITGPAEGVLESDGFSGQYTFVATDPDGDKIKYGIDWNNDDEIDEWLPGSAMVQSGVSRSIKKSWDTLPQTFRVITEDTNGARSKWATFTVKREKVSRFPSSCSVTKGFVGETTTYTATPDDATKYVWKEENGLFTITKTNTNTLSYVFKETGQYRTNVEITKENTQTQSCQIATVSCNKDHKDGEEAKACTDGKRKVWRCGLKGWIQVEEDCPPPPEDVKPLATFEFDPSIVKTSGQTAAGKCGLTLNAEMVSICTLTASNSSLTPIEIKGDDNYDISISQVRKVAPGRWTLSCLNPAGEEETSFGTRTCVGDFESKEE